MYKYMYAYKEGRWLHKMETNIKLLGTACPTTKRNFSNYSNKKSSFLSLLTATLKKPTTTFCHSRLPQLAFCYCKPKYYLQK